MDPTGLTKQTMEAARAMSEQQMADRPPSSSTDRIQSSDPILTDAPDDLVEAVVMCTEDNFDEMGSVVEDIIKNPSNPESGTGFAGFNLNIGCGVGIGLSFGVVADSENNIGLAGSAGLYLMMPEASLAAQGSISSTSNIYGLAGKTRETELGSSIFEALGLSVGTGMMPSGDAVSTGKIGLGLTPLFVSGGIGDSWTMVGGFNKETKAFNFRSGFED